MTQTLSVKDLVQTVGNTPGQKRPFVDQARIHLNERRSGADPFIRILGREDAADSDEGQPAFDSLKQAAQDFGRPLGQRPSAQPADFIDRAAQARPIQRGIGGNQAGNTNVKRQLGNLPNLGLAQVGRNFDHNRFGGGVGLLGELGWPA